MSLGCRIVKYVEGEDKILVCCVRLGGWRKRVPNGADFAWRHRRELKVQGCLRRFSRGDPYIAPTWTLSEKGVVDTAGSGKDDGAVETEFDSGLLTAWYINGRMLMLE